MLVSLGLATLVLSARAPVHASPGAAAESAAPTDRLPALTTWHAPAVSGGGVAPTIVLRVLVSEQGAVEQAEVLRKRAGLEGAEQRALEAVHGFKFQPALKGGKPSKAWITLNLPLQPAAPSERAVVVKGSDTMGANLVPAWVQGLQRSQPDLSVHIESLGSSTGFAGLLDGSADLAASSRLINGDEATFADKLGVQLHEIFVGYDGIAIIVHPDNPLRTLDMSTLAKIFSERVTNWKEIGGPDLPIRAIGRPAYSGTYAYFKDRVLAPLGADAKFGPNVKKVEETESIVAAVSRDPSAIAYVGLAYVRPEVHALPLSAKPGAAAVQPSEDAIYNVSYPLARPLLLYMRTDASRDARLLVDYALSDPGQALLRTTGFVPMPGRAAAAFAARAPAPRVPSPEVLRIHFDLNSAAIAQESTLDVMRAAKAVQADRPILLVGNADSTGTPEANRVLARQRAESVAARLRELTGRRDAPIEIMVAATTHPLASNSTADGRHANRRVDVVILDTADKNAGTPASPETVRPQVTAAKSPAHVQAAASH